MFGKRKSAAEEQEEFGRRALGIVRVQAGIADVEFAADDFEIRYRAADGGQHWINLANVYRSCSNVPDEVAREELERFLLSMLAMPASVGHDMGWNAVRPRLRPVLRPAGELALRIEGTLLAGHSLWRPVLPCLMERVVIDTPSAMTTVTPQHMADWGVEADTVFDAARANMSDLAAATVSAFNPRERDVLYLPDGDGEMYAGSLPLMPAWLASIGDKSAILPIVFVPGASGVLMGLATSPERVAELVAAARQLYDEAPRPVSPVPYTIDSEGRLTPFLVDRDHPAWAGIRSAQATLAARVYGQQYDALRSDLDAGLIEDFAAKLVHIRAADGTETTFAAWTDTVPTLLPRAHNVSLTNADTGSTIVVPWEVLANEVPLEPVPGLYPERYRVEFHPGAEVMAGLAVASEAGLA